MLNFIIRKVWIFFLKINSFSIAVHIHFSFCYIQWIVRIKMRVSGLMDGGYVFCNFLTEYFCNTLCSSFMSILRSLPIGLNICICAINGNSFLSRSITYFFYLPCFVRVIYRPNNFFFVYSKYAFKISSSIISNY